MSTEKIVAAAVSVEGVTISLPQPARHGHVLWALDNLIGESKRGADEEGHILEWTELAGSFRGDLNHVRALTNAGYIIVETQDKQEIA